MVWRIGHDMVDLWHTVLGVVMLSVGRVIGRFSLRLYLRFSHVVGVSEVATHFIQIFNNDCVSVGRTRHQRVSQDLGGELSTSSQQGSGSPNPS
jgi:hypothetical protein